LILAGDVRSDVTIYDVLDEEMKFNNEFFSRGSWSVNYPLPLPGRGG
jgi:hypothetical protein